MRAYCAVVLLSPILEDVFSLEGLKNHGIARSRNLDRGQTSGESHINLPSWGRAYAGIAKPAPGCSDGPHRAD